jgi:hypothetical protein
LDRERAHCHFEINLMLHSRFDEWNGSTDGAGNPHGRFNGRNLAGIPAARYFLSGRAQPGLKVRDFLREQPAHYRVLVPKEGSQMEILRRYSWLKTEAAGTAESSGNAWEITFDGSGLPLAVASASPEVPLSQPQVSWVRDSPHSQAHHTRGRLTNSGKHLTARGLRYINLVTGRF